MYSIIAFTLSISMFSASLGAVEAIESAGFLSWDQALSRLRAQGGPIALYCGTETNRLPRLIASGMIDTKGIPVVIVPSTQPILNPFSGRSVPGYRLHDHFGATAGTMVFLDKDGMAVPAVAMPWALHRDSPDVIRLICGYVAGGHQNVMDLTEYARAIGQEGVIVSALKQYTPALTGREITDEDVLPTLRNAITGEVIDTWKDVGVFYVFATRADSPVFLAQVNEIWNAFSDLQPQVTLVVPDGEEPAQAKLPSGMRAILAHAPREAIAMLGPGPSTICTADTDGRKRGLRFDGFIPATVYSRLLGIPVRHRELLNRDIPHGETDDTLNKVTK